MKKESHSFFSRVSAQFWKHRLGGIAFTVICLFAIIGIYAPLLASSKPLWVQYKGEWYFPLFRYLFYPGFYTKILDLFYNLLMFTLPLFFLLFFLFKQKKTVVVSFFICQVILFLFVIIFPPHDPAFNKMASFSQKGNGWSDELQRMSPYAQLNLQLRYHHYLVQHEKFKVFEKKYLEKNRGESGSEMLFPSLWNFTFKRENQEGQYFKEKLQWLESGEKDVRYEVMPLFRPFHWEDDAGGDSYLNHLVNWYDRTRINRKDLVASLIFGIRVSLSVGFLAVGIALLIGVPIGAYAGYYGGKLDLFLYRLIEIWESMPAFFMLLMIVAFLQAKSIFLIIAVIGLFGWTAFSRFIRGEFFRQKELLYVEASKAMGYRDNQIIFSHMLPNAIPPLLTLIPFAIMGAITSEAGLSFLGLGEEGSNSWGVLMDEGRSVFPAESYLLWPPAILLTILLVSIAIVGDAFRDSLDPKLHQT